MTADLNTAAHVTAHTHAANDRAARMDAAYVHAAREEGARIRVAAWMCAAWEVAARMRAARESAARMRAAREDAAWMSRASNHAAAHTARQMAAPEANACRLSAGTLADAYRMTDRRVTDRDRLSRKTRNRLIPITAQTAAGAAERLDLNHQIFQFERFHCVSSFGRGPRSLRHAIACGEGKMRLCG